MADKRLQLYRANAFLVGGVGVGVGDIMHQIAIHWGLSVRKQIHPPPKQSLNTVGDIMVYLWLNSSMEYAEYGGKTEQDRECILWESPVLGKPLPPLERWTIPTLVQYLNGGKRLKKVTDCINAGLHSLINQKTAELLSDVWEKHATLYPVILEDRPDEPYYMVVVHTVIDCIDREQSVGTVNEFEDHEKYGYFDLIREWVFREEEIGDNLMFVLPDNPAIIYVTEQFKQRVVDAGLKGFGFRKAFFDETAFIS